MPIDFKPSQVALDVTVVPLLDTFGQAEVEAAAAWIVLGLQKTVDDWQPIAPLDVARTVRNHLGRKGYGWLSNPFLVSHFDALIEGGVRTLGRPRVRGAKAPGRTDRDRNRAPSEVGACMKTYGTPLFPSGD